MTEHKSEIRTQWRWNGPRTFLTCTCDELEVEIPQGESVDFPIAKYAAHAFEVAIRGGARPQVIRELEGG